MYQNTSTEFNNIIEGDGRTFYARLVCGDEILTRFMSAKLTSQANEDTNTISIGGTVSSFIEVSMEKPDTLLTGKEYSFEIGLMVGEAMEWVPMGVFTPQKPQESDGLVTFTAYDRMVSKLSGAYFTDITSYPADGKVILQEIAAKTGISLGNLNDLPSGVMVPMRTQTGEEGTTTANPFDGYTYREAVKYLAQMYGKFATFNRSGELEFRWYTESGFATNRLYAEPETSESVYTLQKITCTAGENTLTAGSGTTGISIENPVMTQEILDNVFSKIGGMEYLPTTCSFFGDIRLDLGDIVTVQGRTGIERKVPVMSLSVDFDGGITTDIGSYGNTEEEESQTKGPTATALDRVYTDLFLVREVLANKVSTKVLEADYATIKQLDAVNARIDKITSTEITTEYLEANYASINLANVKVESVQDLFVNVGLIKDATIVDGHITGYLDAISINANSITGGTLNAAEIEVINLNCANLTVGQINGQQIASGAIDMDNLSESLSDTIVQTEEDVLKALEEAGLATEKAESAQTTADTVKENSIYSVDVLYALSASATVAPTSGWQTTAPEWVDGKYMWQKTVTTYGDGTEDESEATCISGATGAKGDKGDKGDTGAQGATGAKGDKGDTGETGKSIGTITNYYLATSSSSGVTTTTSGWTTAVQSVSSSKKYLWNYEKITYSDGTTASTSEPCIIGAYGDKGDTGAAGSTGATGNGISSITEKYAVSTSNTTAPTSWSTAVPTMTATNKYLWNYEEIVYTSGDTKTTSKRVIGVYGDKGAQGATGATGKGVVSIVEQYYLSTSNTTQTGGSWSTTCPAWESGKYIWTRSYITWSDNTTSTTTPTLANGINSANSTADGKNTVFYQTSAPSTTGRKVNDIWFDTDDGNKMYYWSGSAWTAQTFGTSAIAASSVTAEKIVSGAVTTAKIAASAVTTEKLYALSVTAAKIAAGAIETDKLAANAVTAAKVAAGAITASHIAAGAISTDKLSAGAVTADILATDSVTSDKIIAGAITAEKIAAKTITADKINVSDLFAQNITATGSITGAKLYSAYIETTSGKIGGFTINNDGLDGGTISLYSGDSLNGGNLTIGGSEFDGCEITYAGTGVIISKDGKAIGAFRLQNYDSRGIISWLDADEIWEGGTALSTKYNPLMALTSHTSFSAVSVASGVVTSLGKFTLASGKWLIIAYATFATNSTGSRCISTGVNTTRNRYNSTACRATSSGATILQNVRAFTISSSTTIHLYASQDSGSALNVSGGYTLIKIA